MRGILIAAGMLLAVLTLGLAPAGESVASPLERYDPQLALGGSVLSIAMQADGGAILGGEFKSINGTPRSNLARRLPSGELDTSWQVDVDGVVKSVVIDAGGTIYIGGNFGHVAGLVRQGVAKISAAGIVDPSWAPSFHLPSVRTLLLDQQGALLVSGQFDGVDGDGYRLLVKLSTSDSGVRDEAWDPNPNNVVDALAVGPDGAVYVGGEFTTISGVARSRLARLVGSDAQADPDWDFTFGVGQYVKALVVDDTNRVYAGGNFTSVDGDERLSLARFLPGGQLDPDMRAWVGCAGCPVTSLLLDGSGGLYVGGAFSGSSAGTWNLFWLGATGDYQAFGVSDGQVSALALSAAGNLLAAGAFTRFVYVQQEPDTVATDGAAVQFHQRLGFVAIDASGAPLAATDAEMPGKVYAIAVQPNGGVIIGGSFVKGGGTERSNLLRLDTAGVVDSNWAPFMEREVTKLAVDGDDLVYAQSQYRDLSGSLRKGLARLSVSAPAEPVWTLLVGGGLADMFVDGAGMVYLAGDFHQVGGVAKRYLARMSRSGDVDPDWNPPTPTSVSAMAPGAGNTLVAAYQYSAFPFGAYRGEIVRLSTVDGAMVGGVLHSDNGIAGIVAYEGQHYAYGWGNVAGIEGGIARLLANGQVDSTFAPSFNAAVTGLVVGGDGYVYLGGYIYGADEQDTERFLRVSDIDASPDLAWHHTADWHVNVMKIGPSGRIYVGGEFAQIDGVPRAGFAALAADDMIFANGFD